MMENKGSPSPALRVGLRPPDQVMRLARMGSFFPTRLSFMPTLIRRLCREGWTVSRPHFELTPEGYGHAVYSLTCAGRCYSLAAFSHALEPAARTDRVIAESWDSTFALFDGVPTGDDIIRLQKNAPKQEAGRFLPSELVLSRANRSVRFFDHVVESLASGRQPDRKMLASVGYLMRTTAVYGNGKFGIADRQKISDRPELSGPFQAELMAVYLIRCFTTDLAEHIARHRAPQTFVPLDPELKRHIGIGNATGLGMAPFLINHPVVINNWILARETALARVRSVERVESGRFESFRRDFETAQRHAAEWSVEDARQSARINRLRGDLARMAGWINDSADWRGGSLPWDRLFRRAEEQSGMEGQELLVSILLESHGDLVDDLSDGMSALFGERLMPAMGLGELRKLIQAMYGWALAIDFDRPEAQHYFWYVSEEKIEPRLGNRHEEPGAEKEMPLAIARDVQALGRALDHEPAGESVANFVMRHPEFRHVVRRVQTIARHPYGEIRDNLLAAECLPIDLLRCKLSFFGASKYDPKSDRWIRITLYQGAPLPEELAQSPGPETAGWRFPTLESPA